MLKFVTLDLMVLDSINLINNSNSRKITPLRIHYMKYLNYTLKIHKKTYRVISMLKFGNFNLMLNLISYSNNS